MDRERSFNVPPCEDEPFSDMAYDQLNTNLKESRSYGYGPLEGIYKKHLRTPNYWTTKITYLLAQHKSRVIKFARILANLLAWDLSDVIHEFPRDYMTPLETGNKTITEVLEGLFKNLPNSVDSREWQVKQAMIRSILQALKEYNSTIKQKKTTTIKKTKKTFKTGAKLNAESALVEPEHISSKFLVLREYPIEKGPELEDTALRISRYSKGLTTLISSVNTIIREESMILNNTAIPVSEYNMLTLKLMDHLKLMSQETTYPVISQQLPIIIQDIQEYTKTLTNEDGKIPVKILIKFVDMIQNVSVSLFNPFLIARAYTKKLADIDPTDIANMNTIIAEVVKNLRTLHSHEVYDDILTAYLNEETNKGYRLKYNVKTFQTGTDTGHAEDSVHSDVADLLVYLNELGNSMENDPDIKKAWSISDDAVSLIFFTDKIQGFLELSLGRIQRIQGKKNITMMELITADADISTNFARAVYLEYNLARANIRDKTGPSHNRFAYDVTRYQHVHDKSDVQGLHQFFSHVHRIEFIEKQNNVPKKKTILVYDTREPAVVAMELANKRQCPKGGEPPTKRRRVNI